MEAYCSEQDEKLSQRIERGSKIFLDLLFLAKEYKLSVFYSKGSL